VQGKEPGTIFVPLTFEALLHYLYMKENRENYTRSIDESRGAMKSVISTEKRSVKIENDMQNFVSLLSVGDVETTDYSVARKYLYNHEIALKAHNMALKRKLT
jgi:hypothetical protein